MKTLDYTALIFSKEVYLFQTYIVSLKCLIIQNIPNL